MPEVQKHGFIFEDWVKGVLGLRKLATKYTQKWDVPGLNPISVKCMGLTNALEFGSTVRIWEINEPFTLIVGRWVQKKKQKLIVSIDEINISVDMLKKMRGQITLEEVKKFDKKIKSFPPGEKGQDDGIAYAEKWKSDRKDRMGLLTITHKIDSKDQRRIQCNMNATNYVKLFGNPSMSNVFRGHRCDKPIKHKARTFND